MVPWDTIRKRVEDSANDNGCVTPLSIEQVSPRWCDPENVHVYLHIDPGEYTSTNCSNYPD